MLKVRFSIVRDVEDKWPVTYVMPWDELAKRLARHDEGEKGGTALVCGTFEKLRLEAGNGQERQLVALDVETSKETGEVPPNPSTTTKLMAVKRIAGVVWTTHSHTLDAPRYRVVMPIDEPIKLTDWPREVDKMMVTNVAIELGLQGVTDRGKRGSESLFFLARHDIDRPFFSEVTLGNPIRSAELLTNAFHIVNHVAIRKTQLDAMRKAAAFPPELKQYIDAYNDGHEIKDLLHHYDYMPAGGRFKSKYQSPGSTAATAIFPDATGWYSWSESDRAAGLGSPCDDGVFGDAFSLYMHYEHGGDFRRAVQAMKERAAR